MVDRFVRKFVICGIGEDEFPIHSVPRSSHCPINDDEILARYCCDSRADSCIYSHNEGCSYYCTFPKIIPKPEKEQK